MGGGMSEVGLPLGTGGGGCPARGDARTWKDLFGSEGRRQDGARHREGHSGALAAFLYHGGNRILRAVGVLPGVTYVPRVRRAPARLGSACLAAHREAG